ncbi:MAG: hypothetical protein Q8941_11425 [Bacteroidota bacterium]|nr:hypothetical protein [Bacteroidota bacterium]
MKKPAVFISVLFISIICSTILVSTTISGIMRSFYKDGKNSHAKVSPAENNLNKDLKVATVKL